MNEEDKNWLLDTLKEYLTDNDFYGKIELNIQASRIVAVNINRSIKPPKIK